MRGSKWGDSLFDNGIDALFTNKVLAIANDGFLSKLARYDSMAFNNKKNVTTWCIRISINSSTTKSEPFIAYHMDLVDLLLLEIDLEIVELV